MQFIQTRAYERKRKCKRKLARERKRARVKRKILRAQQWRGLQKGEKKMILSNVGIVHRLLNGLGLRKVESSEVIPGALCVSSRTMIQQHAFYVPGTSAHTSTSPWLGQSHLFPIDIQQSRVAGSGLSLSSAGVLHLEAGDNGSRRCSCHVTATCALA